jgi:uncharacterized phage-associated protein
VPYTPLAIANSFVKRSLAQNRDINHMKLQKLVYFVHGWWLAYNDAPLLTERPQMWKYGPVFPTLYHELKTFGNSSVPGPVRSNPFSQAMPDVPATDQQATALIDWVWERYGHLSAFALSDLTHSPGSAWHAVAVAHDFRVPKGFDLGDAAVKAEFEAEKSRIAG